VTWESFTEGSGQGAPSQHGRIHPQPGHRSWDASHRIIAPQFGHGSVSSATPPRLRALVVVTAQTRFGASAGVTGPVGAMTRATFVTVRLPWGWPG
jgi:hypothetical protein